jgi:hypothetical protein
MKWNDWLLLNCDNHGPGRDGKDVTECGGSGDQIDAECKNPRC